jgi:hypothetical protein
MHTFLRQYQLEEPTKIDLVINALEGEAYEVIGRPDRYDSVEKLFEKLAEAFAPVDDPLARLETMRQRSEETVQVFASRVTAQVEKLEIKADRAEYRRKKHFVAGLKPEIRRTVEGLFPTDYATALKQALAVEEKLKSQHSYRSSSINQISTDVEKRNANKVNIVCFHCKKQGHRYLRCFKATQEDKDRITKELRDKRQQQENKNGAQQSNKDSLNANDVRENNSRPSRH